MLDSKYAKKLLHEKNYQDLLTYMYDEYILIFKEIFDKYNVEQPNSNIIIDYVVIGKQKISHLKTIFHLIGYAFSSEDNISENLETLFECYPILVNDLKKKNRS